MRGVATILHDVYFDGGTMLAHRSRHRVGPNHLGLPAIIPDRSGRGPRLLAPVVDFAHDALIAFRRCAILRQYLGQFRMILQHGFSLLRITDRIGMFGGELLKLLQLLL